MKSSSWLPHRLTCLAVVLGLLGVSQVAAQDATLVEEPSKSGQIVDKAPSKIEAPFLWVIKGETPQYLLGTIHVPDARVLSLHPAIDKAMEAADEIYVELAPQDQLQQLQVLRLPAGTKLSDELDEKLIARIDQQLKKINPALSHSALPFRIWAWPLVLPSLKAQMSDPNGVVMDMKLVKFAEDKELPVKSLEDPKTQLSGFEAFSTEDQLAFLTSTLDDMESDEDEEDPMEKLIGIYLSGDSQALSNVFLEEFNSDELPEGLGDKLVKALLTQRNEQMAETILDAMKAAPEKTHLFAAGTAHYVVGPTVIDLLKKKGFEIERVE